MAVLREDPAKSLAIEASRPIWIAVKLGWRQKCPACGKGSLYNQYLKVNDACPACGEELHHHRADDAPPYFTMLITGHVIVGGILLVQQIYAPENWVQLAIWMPLLVILSLFLLPRIKGALIGYQWACRMHGFGQLQVEGADIAPIEPAPNQHS